MRWLTHILLMLFAASAHGATIAGGTVSGGTVNADTFPPTPDPMTFATAPAETGVTSIDMTATTATDAWPSNPVEYMFESTDGGGFSGWQASVFWEDGNLEENTSYTYRVQARDALDNRTVWSIESVATTAQTDSDVTGPVLNATEWALSPVTVSSTTILMTAGVATDDTIPITYQFEEVTPTPGVVPGCEWSESRDCQASGLTSSTAYTFKYTARDNATTPNETESSAPHPGDTTDSTLGPAITRLELWDVDADSVIDADIEGTETYDLSLYGCVAVRYIVPDPECVSIRMQTDSETERNEEDDPFCSGGDTGSLCRCDDYLINKDTTVTFEGNCYSGTEQSGDEGTLYTRTVTFDQGTSWAVTSVVVDKPSGDSPLNDVEITCEAEGTATGDITWKYRCDSDVGFTEATNSPQTGQDSDAVFVVADLCDYSGDDTYSPGCESTRAGVTDSGSTTVQVGELGGDMQGSMTTNDITFTFDTTYPTGRFVDGEPWVVENTPGGGVTVNSMTPAYSGGQNGFEVNRTVMSRQSLDSRINTSFDAPPSLPLPATFAADTSVLKSKAYLDGGSDCGDNSAFKTCLDQASILTVLASVPPDNSFRPPYYGTEKPIFSADDIDFSRLPKVADVGSRPSLADAEAVFNGPWVDSIDTSRNRYGHPGNAMRTVGGGSSADYGTNLALSITTAMLRTMHNDTDADKEELVYNVIQYGIDTYYLVKNGMTYEPNGGIMMGRKAPVLYAGHLLQDDSTPANAAIAAAMLNINATHNPGPNGNKTDYAFQEDGILRDATAGVDIGRPVWGEPEPCTAYDRWIDSGSGGKACADFTSSGGYGDGESRVDGSRCQAGTWCDAAPGAPNIPQPTLSAQEAAGTFSLGSYQRYTAVWFGIGAAMELMGLDDEWGQANFFEYVDRIASPPWSYWCGQYCSTYMVNMHQTHTPPP